MFLKILEKLGRQKVVFDRGPSHPEFEKAKVKEPVFIMGVNRSGTTFFHKLLASSNQFSTSKTWDLIIPSLSLRKFAS